MVIRGTIGDDAVLARFPQTHKVRADAGQGIRSLQGPVGADGVPDRCPRQYKHDPRLLEAPWRTTAPLVPMLCQRGATIITRHEPMLVQAFTSTKASLVLMVYETGAPRSTSMCLDCSRYLGVPRPHRCRCYASPRQTRHEPMLVEASARSKARWCRWCARQVPQAA